jgi:DNA (cytosine-5)-methyltransferase 1
MESLKVLSLFSGCGGMDLGFEGGFRVHHKSINKVVHPDWLLELNTDKKWQRLPRTRFQTVFANDISKDAKAAWIPYFSKRADHDGIFNLSSIVDLVKEHEKGNKVFPNADVVTGGFPCQDFSLSGKRKGFNSHKDHDGKIRTEIEKPTEENRGLLYMWMRRVIGITKPKVFVAENVKGLVSLSNTKQIIQNDFRNIGAGYVVVDAKVLYAPEYGVPQTRERVIFIGLRKDVLRKEALLSLEAQDQNQQFSPYPIITHQLKNSSAFEAGRHLPFVTVQDYLQYLREPSLSNDLSQQSYSRAKYYGKHVQGQIEVDLSGLGPTIRAEHHGNIEFRRLSLEHGGKNQSELNRGLIERRLTVRECARIQTFPDEFEFVRQEKDLGKPYGLSASAGYRLIGNAVPPLLAFHIAWRLQEIWQNLFINEEA